MNMHYGHAQQNCKLKFLFSSKHTPYGTISYHCTCVRTLLLSHTETSIYVCCGRGSCYSSKLFSRGIWAFLVAMWATWSAQYTSRENIYLSCPTAYYLVTNTQDKRSEQHRCQSPLSHKEFTTHQLTVYSVIQYIWLAKWPTLQTMHTVQQAYTTYANDHNNASTHLCVPNTHTYLYTKLFLEFI